MTDQQQKKKKKTSRISLLIRLIIAATALYLVFRGENLKELYYNLINLNPIYFILSIVFYLIGQFLFVIRWRTILKVQDVHISLMAGFKLHLLGLFYNNCLPSSVGGDILRAWYVTKHAPNNKRVEAAFSVLIDRFVGLTGMIIMAITAYWLIPIEAQQQQQQSLTSQSSGFFQILIDFWKPIAAVSGLVLVVFAGLLIVPKTRNRIVMLCQKLWSLYRRLWNKCFTAMKIYFKRPLTMFFAYILTFLCQSIPILGLYLLGKNLGMPAHIKYYFVLFPLSWMISSIPISIGGIGITEGWLKIMFAALNGVTTTQAAALAVCQRLMWLIGSLPGFVIHLIGAHLPSQKDEFFIDGDPG